MTRAFYSIVYDIVFLIERKINYFIFIFFYFNYCTYSTLSKCPKALQYVRMVQVIQYFKMFTNEIQHNFTLQLQGDTNFFHLTYLTFSVKMKIKVLVSLRKNSTLLFL